MNELSKDELKELKKELEREPEIFTKEATIIYDKRQYAVRIPAKVAKVMAIDEDKDKILFTMRIPSKIGEMPELEIRLVKH